MSSHFLTQYGGHISQFLSFCGRLLVVRGGAEMNDVEKEITFMDVDESVDCSSMFG
jgi:hypothetical protein